MLSNIKTYQWETESQRFLSQNPPLYCTLGCLFIKGSLLILTSSCHVCLHPHKTLWLYWLGGLEGSKWIRVLWVWFATPWKRKFRFSVKVNIYLKPCICLKSENVNIENEGGSGKIIEFLKSCISKW